VTETTHAWQDASLPPRERAEKLVAAMTLEQKIAQLHGAMETIDIHAITADAAESGADMDQLAAQIQIERHVKAIEELGVPVDGQPPKRLVGFQKVRVEPGASRPVTITVDPAATNHPFGVWDSCTRSFVTKPGEYTVYVGNSADNTPRSTTFTVAREPATVSRREDGASAPGTRLR
jgi:Fibronectin type III-like domain